MIYAIDPQDARFNPHWHTILGLWNSGCSHAPVWDYESLDSCDEFRSLVDDATLIIALDLKGEGASCVFGREVLAHVSHKTIPPQVMVIAFFAIDFNTPQVEHLCSAVKVFKGFHEWGS